ncbi:TPA: hypothetical protein VDT15_000207 [Pseudomonas aeruginosa]|nr:hypothetical protein [Pseudomonas aeruginosa]
MGIEMKDQEEINSVLLHSLTMIVAMLSKQVQLNIDIGTETLRLMKTIDRPSEQQQEIVKGLRESVDAYGEAAASLTPVLKAMGMYETADGKD